MGDGLTRLLTAYRATRYAVADGGGEIAVRIGTHAPALDALLARHGARSGVFLTAWNPASRPLPPAENAAAAAALAETVAARGLRALPHRGIPDDPAWPVEEGLFILDIAESEAVALAEAFGQNALVLAERGRPPRLIRTRLMGGAVTPAG